ncbi:hypothetical protein CL633_01610 [bacterium]|nr:hypothetical protein [bacterium]|tara:strand:+ start:8684 stop:8983 length:300 start_codon:yes stop_codon:yes gene_type:complete
MIKIILETIGKGFLLELINGEWWIFRRSSINISKELGLKNIVPSPASNNEDIFHAYITEITEGLGWAYFHFNGPDLSPEIADQDRMDLIAFSIKRAEGF